MIECEDLNLESSSYLNLMHSLSILALFMNMFAIYCIICKSTKHMGAYKWYLLVYQTASIIYDTVYTGLILPVIYFPMAMGYPGSWIAHWLSITAHAGVVMVFLTCSLLVACILNLFNYRCHLVTPSHHFLKINNNGHVYTSFAVTLTYFISCSLGMMDILPDQEEAKKWVLQRYTCAKFVIHVPRLTVFMLNKGMRIAMTVIVLAVVAAALTLIWIFLSFYFIRRSGHLSQKTKQMQRRFLIYLCVQVAIPMISMLIPILMLVYVFGTLSQPDLGNVALALIGSHGCVASLSLVMCNEPYRKFFTSLLMNAWRRRRANFRPTQPEFTRTTQIRVS